MGSPGVRELAQALADAGQRVLLWDRPNTGASDVCFRGDTESEMQADALAGLSGSGPRPDDHRRRVRRRPGLDARRSATATWPPASPSGGSAVDRTVCSRWATHYCGPSIKAGWNGGMEAVAALPDWAESQECNPRNRDLLRAQDPADFLATMERWMLAYCPCR